MNNFFKDITFIIVSFQSEKVIDKCIDSLNSVSKILVIENSNNHLIKQNLEKKYSNLKVKIVGKNLGYSKANNLGLEMVKTKYAFILNPDASLAKNALKEIEFAISFLKNDFTLLGPKFFEMSRSSSLGSDKENIVDKVDYIKGFAIFINMKKINFKPIFDENFFLFLEEIDLCKRVNESDGKIYIVNKSYVYHKGKKSSGNDLEIEKCRNWHWMWSLFFYNKKHYGNLTAYRVTLYKFFSSLLKFLIGFIFFKNKSYLIYKSRIEGLINAYFNKSSWKRPYE
jgi:GT2 family glycosyltransferase